MLNCLLSMAGSMGCGRLMNRRFFWLNNNSKNVIVKCRNRRIFQTSKLSTHKINSLEYCIDLVRKHDYENYLCTLLLPEYVRASALVIRAFNVELAQVRDLVSNPAIGYMRIQFWKDTLDQVFMGQPPAQPVATQLAEVFKRHKLSKMWFERLISCRESIMSDKGFLTVEELEDYCEQSVSSVYYLILQSMGFKNLHCDHAASHMSKSQGIVTLLRGIPFNASKGRVYLPMEVMSKHKVSEDNVIKRKHKEYIVEVVFELASLAHQHLKLARSFHENIPEKACAVFLPADLSILQKGWCWYGQIFSSADTFIESLHLSGVQVSTALFLESLQKYEFDIFNPKLQLRNYWLPISLYVHKFRKIY